MTHGMKDGAAFNEDQRDHNPADDTSDLARRRAEWLDKVPMPRDDWLAGCYPCESASGLWVLFRPPRGLKDNEWREPATPDWNFAGAVIAALYNRGHRLVVAHEMVKFLPEGIGTMQGGIPIPGGKVTAMAILKAADAVWEAENGKTNGHEER